VPVVPVVAALISIDIEEPIYYNTIQ